MPGIRTFTVTPERAEYFRRFDGTSTWPPHSQAIRFLYSAKATRSAVVGEFDFPEGRMRVEGFDAEHVGRIGDWFRILELGREVGYANPPKPAIETTSNRGFSSPVLPFVFLAVFCVPVIAVTLLSLAGALPSLGGSWIAGVCILPIVAVGLVLSGRRLRWYSRVRARVAETGERMPHGLGLVD